MKITLTVKNWENIFQINRLDIADELNWDYFCFNEGTANENTEATLNIVQISKLSPLDSQTITNLIKSIKGTL